MDPRSDTAVLALDWGTSAARAYRLGRAGAVLERREAPLGVMHLASGAHASALRSLLGDWAELDVPRIASGMIGSRQGWLEVPYVECPADPAALVAGIRATPGRELSIVPGLVCRDAGHVPDVLRGEEAQILGAIPEDDATVLAVLPGTHSKWVYVAEGRIVAFSTYMTGELFAVLLQHSILGRLATGPSNAPATDSEAFADGVGTGLRSDGLTHTIFAARSRCLLGELGPADVGDWLSGVLIGHEIAAARRWAADFAPPAAPVWMIGSDALVERYRVALGRADVPAVAAAPEAAARGLYRIAVRAGMVS
jgi:2-dehydro-3-deoxygalactonokinase